MADIAVTGVSLDLENMFLMKNDTQQLVATVSPADATNKNVTWSSSNNEVATVAADGKVTAKIDNGNCTITVTTEDGGFTANCNVVVSSEATSIVLDRVLVKMEENSNITLNYYTQPEGSYLPNPVVWSSSNTEIATVDEYGTVTTNTNHGETTITVSSGSLSDSCIVKVVTMPTNITILEDRITHFLNITESETLHVIFEPEDCDERELIWDSTNENIATYDTENNVIHYGGRLGTCQLQCTDIVGHQDEIFVDVYRRQEKPNPPMVASVTRDTIILGELEFGEYSIDGGETWVQNNTFSGLNYNTEYTFIQRYREDDYTPASEPSDPTTVTTEDIIHVTSINIKRVTNPYEMIASEGRSYKFDIEILPENADFKELYCTFDKTEYSFLNNNNSVGMVNNYGDFTINGLGEGYLNIRNIYDPEVRTSLKIIIRDYWDTPTAPLIQAIVESTDPSVSTYNLIVQKTSPDMMYRYGTTSLTDTDSNIIPVEKIKEYTIKSYLKRNDQEYRLESKLSPATKISIPKYLPEPGSSIIQEILLSARELTFNLDNPDQIYVVLNYSLLPINTLLDKNVYWYSNDDSVAVVDSSGKVTAKGVGKCTISIRAVSGNAIAYCDCKVYKQNEKPPVPRAIRVTKTLIELEAIDNGEYSIDGTTWQNSTIFDNLKPDSYYNFYQRYKAKGEFQPVSEPSNALTVKTEANKPGGTSPSGYTFGQAVDVNNIPVYPSPYARKSTFKVSGRYYIFNLFESNHRIRITDIEKYAGVNGQSSGWVNISDLQLIENEIYIGDKVLVNGNINIYADGSGTFIHKDKAEMYITDIIESQIYGYGVTSKPGKNREAFAKREQVTKYKTIEN